MSKPKTYFHNRPVLLFLTVNFLLVIVAIVLSVLPLFGSGGAVISEYRSNLGLDGYRAGNMGDIISFGLFAVIIYAAQLILSKKLYEENKAVSYIILSLTSVLLTFALIVCNALLELR